MRLQTLTDKKILANFLNAAAENSGAEFLASLDWADLLRSEGAEITTWGVYDDFENLSAVFNLLIKKLPLGFKYYYLPRGPIFKGDLSADDQKSIWQFLKINFKQQGAVFLRVEPLSQLDKSLGALKVHNLQPQETLLLDLRPSETELLNSFHQKTRYNIRLAEKKGVTIREGLNPADFADFWRLMTATGERDGFKIHGRRHYQTLASYNRDFIKLFVAENDSRIIAAGLFSFFGDKVTYLHGASDHAARQLMAPYLLQWTLIKLAKEQGRRLYDFYGIDDLKWPGVTRFKLGFSGFRFSYAGTHDIILNRSKYNLYRLLKQLRQIL